MRYFAAGSDVVKSTVFSVDFRLGWVGYGLDGWRSDFDQLVGVLGELALDVFAGQRDA